MVLGGDLTTMALPDLLQWLEQTNQTGLLILERPSGKTAVWVRAREVVGISTPSGITAPVNIRAACLGKRLTLARSPAAIRATIGNWPDEGATNA